jgi:hypothetical protein
VRTTQDAVATATTRTLPSYSNACRWDRSSSSLDNCNEVSFAPRATAAALELGSPPDRKRHMVYVAVYLR